MNIGEEAVKARRRMTTVKRRYANNMKRRQDEARDQMSQEDKRGE